MVKWKTCIEFERIFIFCETKIFGAFLSRTKVVKRIFGE